MSDYIFYYLLFSYLYMGHRYTGKVKGEIPEQVSEYPVESGLIVTFFWLLSPVTFLIHIAYQLKERFIKEGRENDK